MLKTLKQAKCDDISPKDAFMKELIHFFIIRFIKAILFPL